MSVNVKLCFFSVSQPDLLNFKKGWMSKLDDSGEVKHIHFSYTTLLLNSQIVIVVLFK